MIYDYAAIGQRLRKKRLELGKDLGDIVEEIKISEEYIKAIEDGDLTALPSEVYYGLFVRSYAKELGYDAEKLLEEFATEEPSEERESKPEKDKPEPAIKKPREEERPAGRTSPLVVALWVAGVVVVVIAVVILLSTDYEDQSEVASPLAEKADTMPSMVFDETTDSISTDSGEIETGGPADNMIPDEILPDLILDIDVNALSWVVVVADGDTILIDNLDSGFARTLAAREGFVISLGNPSGVALRLNKQPLRSLAPGGRVINNVVIDRSNFEDFFLNNEDGAIEEN
jgi:cytoskeleton protein RodZ